MWLWVGGFGQILVTWFAALRAVARTGLRAGAIKIALRRSSDGARWVFAASHLEVGKIDWMTDLIERELSCDRRISMAERGLYVVVRSLNPVSVTELAQHSGSSVAWASRACANLVDAGWLTTRQFGRVRRMLTTVPELVQAKQAGLLSEIYSMQPFKGEFLLKVLLDAHVLSRKYVDNARPKWLENPATGEQLEIDRLYVSESEDPESDMASGDRSVSRREGVESWKSQVRVLAPHGYEPPESRLHGFEFHGAQHFGVTKAYPDHEEFRKTQIRDSIKKGMCADNGVRLMVVTYKDLSPKGILKYIPRTLPIGVVDLGGTYMRRVSELCANYRAHAREYR